MEKRRGRAGFTLAELLIVVAIVAVLVSIAIPVFAGGRERASAAQCLANRTMIEHAIKVEQMLADDFSGADTAIVDKILKAAAGDGGGYFAGPCICNEGGAYRYSDYDFANGRVVCTVKSHNENGGGSDGGGGNKPQYAEHVDVYMSLADLRAELAADKEAFKKKYGITNNNLGNTVLRNLIREQNYGGEWPALSQGIQEKSGVKSQLYVQPFFSENLSNDEAILYANTSKDRDSWSANLVGKYDEATQTILWYKRADNKTIPLTDQYKREGWAYIQENIDNGTMVEVK